MFVDKDLERLLEIVVPSYLPGISLSLTKILTAHGEKAKVLEVSVYNLMSIGFYLHYTNKLCLYVAPTQQVIYHVINFISLSLVIPGIS